jgi:hypothetical protein
MRAAGAWLAVGCASVFLLGCGASDKNAHDALGKGPKTVDGAGPSGPVEPTDPAAKLLTGDPEPASPPVLTGCGIDSGYAGDELCILPPPPDQGFQIHYGPANYDDPDEVAKYLINAGDETNQFLPATAGNTEDVYYYGRQYRMRPGSHHLIVSEAGNGTGAIIGAGRRLGGTQNPAKDNPGQGTSPEKVGVGIPLSANAPLSLSLHYFNSTDHALLKEVWVNFWYVDADKVTQEAKEIFIWAQGTPLDPGMKETVTGTWPITDAGRVLTMYGHRHSNNVRFSAYRTRGGEKELVYDDYTWEDPTVFEFNSETVNPEPAPGDGRPGGHTGILDLQVGDVLSWQCDVENKRSVQISFGENEAATSEMCILVGDAIGPALLGISRGPATN